MNEVLIKKLTDTATLPKYATPGSAAVDICADCPGGLLLLQGEITLLPTGLSLAIPYGYVGLLFVRSGLSLKGVCLSNGVGVIDSDYRGELKVAMVNNSDESILIEHAMRIAQLMITPFSQPVFIESDELSTTERGAGGFGSTGTIEL